MIPDTCRRTLDRFVAKAREIFGGRLLSVTAYGSVLTAGFDPRVSDINLVVVVEGLSAGDLLTFRRRLGEWTSRTRIAPVFFTPSFIRSSCDVFPIEWREIAARHLVLFGSDLFADLPIRRQDIRLQLERAAKTNFLSLVRALAFPTDLRQTLREAVRATDVFLRNAREVFGPPPWDPPVSLRDLARRPGRKALEEMASQQLAFLHNLLQWCEKVCETREDP